MQYWLGVKRSAYVIITKPMPNKVDVDNSSDVLAAQVSRRLLGAVLHSSNELL